MNSNITALHGSPFRDDSPLYFDVMEHVDGYLDHRGTWQVDPTQKKLVRSDTHQVLATVGSGYKTVQNRDLFQAIEASMTSTVPSSFLEGVTRRASTSFDGKLCVHDYRFPGMKVAFREAEISFRIIAANGFGGSAVKLFAGGIDHFCWNGMVYGVAEKRYAKHTSGLLLSGLDLWLQRQVEAFWVESERMRTWAGRSLDMDEAESLLEKIGMSKRLQKALANQFEQEVRDRGPSLWALYSAMTAYASHENVVPFRRTKHDHREATKLRRGEQVAAWVRHEAFQRATG